ncbi:unnamed protein product [Cunninghamella blakesleeana]
MALIYNTYIYLNICLYLITFSVMPSTTACATQTTHENNYSDNKLPSPITTSIHSPLNSEQTMITNVSQQDPIPFIPTTKTITHSLKELSNLN